LEVREFELPPRASGTTRMTTGLLTLSKMSICIAQQWCLEFIMSNRG